MRVELTVNGATLPMELDTGASVSLIKENTYRNTWLAKKGSHYGPPMLVSSRIQVN